MRKYAMVALLLMGSNLLAAQNSVLAARHGYDEVTETNPFAISLHNPNYVLPYYHNSNITNAVINPPGVTTQDLDHTELKFQLSLKLPILNSYFPERTKLYFGYTQATFWQLYTHDSFIRNTDYEPELFLTYFIDPCSKISLGLNHESNGRGGFFERSWNRLYLDYHYQFNEVFWMSVQPWILVFKQDSSDEHNPDIAHFLGYDQFMFGLNVDNFTITVRLTNIESGFKRGQREINVGYRLWNNWHLFGQIFSGYGQTLLEYDRTTTGVGIGLALNV